MIMEAGNYAYFPVLSHPMTMRFSRGLSSRTCPICGYSLQEEVEKDLAGDSGSRSMAYAQAIVTHIQTVHPDFWSWEQSKRRIGLGLGVVTGALTGIGLFYLLALVLQVPGNWGGFVAILSVGAFFIPYAVIARRGAKHFKSQWLEQGKTATPTFTRPIGLTGFETESAADDDAIMSLATSMQSQLGILGMRISSVAWKSLIPQGRAFVRVPSDGAVFRNQIMYLGANMEGKLSANDWKPLIASAMINYRKLRPQKRRLLFVMAMPVIITYVASWVFLPPLFPTTHSCANGQCAYQNWGIFILIFGGIALFVAMIIAGMLMMQRFRILSDMETVHYFGKNSLTSSLQKVIQASPGDTVNVQRRIDKIERMNLPLSGIG